MNKINYYQKSLAEMAKIHEKKSLLMHTCCAPCATWPLEFLNEKFDVTIMYNNSNIYPESEYQIRKNEIVEYVKIFNEKHHSNLKIIVAPYDNPAFTKKIAILKDEPEGGKRCRYCYSLRMREAYQYAHQHNFDYFCTVMTISRQKDSQIMNQIGHSLERLYAPTKYFYSDFKKKNGNEKGVKIASEYNMYRQLYCGCQFSYEEYLKSDRYLKNK